VGPRGWVLLVDLVVAGEQVGAVHARPLALAPEAADGHEVAAVAHAREVVLLDLEPGRVGVRVRARARARARLRARVGARVGAR